MMTRLMALLSGCALAGLASGCFVDADDDDDVVRTGELAVLWTVDNTVDPAACDYYAPSGAGLDFELAVFDERGSPVALEYAPCEDFGMALLLLASSYGPGYYDAEVTMVDARDRDFAVSTTELLDRVWVAPRTTVELDVNFPPSSFLPVVP